MKITNEQLKKLIDESVQNMFELDVVDDENKTEVNPEINQDLNSSEEVHLDDYFSLGGYISKESNKIDDNLKADIDYEVKSILNRGNSNLTYSNTYKTSKQLTFNLITSILAALYKSASSSERANIRSYIFIAFNPYVGTQGSPSVFAKHVGENSGIKENIYLPNDKNKFYLEMIADAIYESVDKSLNLYNTDYPFTSFIRSNSATATKDAIKTKASKTYFNQLSSDVPAGDEDSEESVASQIPNPEEVSNNSIDNLKDAMASFVKYKLKNVDPMYSEYYEMSVEDGIPAQQIWNEIGKDPRNLKFRLEKYITKFVKDGSFQNFIFKETGIAIQFPNNEFKLIQKNKEGIAAEPILIWKYDESDPDKGEWIDINAKKSKTKEKYKKGLGDVAFGKNEPEWLTEIRMIVREMLIKEDFNYSAEEIEHHNKQHYENGINPEQLKVGENYQINAPYTRGEFEGQSFPGIVKFKGLYKPGEDANMNSIYMFEYVKKPEHMDSIGFSNTYHTNKEGLRWIHEL